MQVPRMTPTRRRSFAWAPGLVLLLAGGASAQTAEKPPVAPQQEIRAESKVTSDHSVTIKGQRVPYRATAGTQPVWSPDGKPIASLFYVFYERTDVKDRAVRPLVISFNGGPGSASVWMHIGYTGPRFLEVDDEGFPIQPYGIRENNHSILDVADIVFVDPVNTGFSRIVGDADRSTFFGVNEDIEYLARWIDDFVSRHERWRSPKFLIGESYGTTRVAGLAARLQESHWMYLNGVILVSPTGLGISRDGPVGSALRLPYFTAAAWYHKALAPELQKRDLEELLPEVEQFTIEQYLPALARGGSLDESRRKQVAAQMARYAGLSEQIVLNNNLAIGTQLFWRELLRERGQTIGRLDSRYVGIGRDNAGITPDFDPALTSWNHSFAPAINHYLRDVLNYETTLQYWLFGPVNPWNRTGDSTGENLRRAMAQNPFLRLMVQAGYYDGATDYFSAKYTMWNMDPSGKLKDRMRFEAYRSGHMMYLRQEDLATSNEHLREFIRGAIPKPGVTGTYRRETVDRS
jgi:carboxypeptidase C (cathepsin A)